jgi:hypothetical protein
VQIDEHEEKAAQAEHGLQQEPQQALHPHPLRRPGHTVDITVCCCAYRCGRVALLQLAAAAPASTAG